MMFPRDNVIYSNLSTSFTAFDSLLADLNARHTTGFIEVVHADYAGALLMSEGEVVNAWAEEGELRGTGQVAARSVADRAAQKNGVINVFASTPDIVLLMHRLTDSRPLYRDLTSAFTNLDGLLGKLRADAITGYLEVHLDSNAGAGVIYFANGEPAQSIFSRGPDTVAGREAFTMIVAEVDRWGATFSVFVEGSREVMAADHTSAEPVAMPVHSDAERDEVLTFWGEVLGATESTIDKLSKPGRFVMAFKEVLVARATSYPFLDPFAAEFQYSAGAVTFDGPLPIDFNRALGDCLSDTVSKLAFQLKRTDLQDKVRHALESLSEKHAVAIHRWGLDEDLQEFVA